MEVMEFGMTVFWQPLIIVFVAVSINALQLFRLSYTLFPLSTIIDRSPLQSANTLPPIDVTEFGIVTEVRLEHSPNAHPPMVVTELGIVIDVMPVQR